MAISSVVRMLALEQLFMCYLGFVEEILHDRHEHNKTMTVAANVIIRGQWVAIIHDHEIQGIKTWKASKTYERFTNDGSLNGVNTGVSILYK